MGELPPAGNGIPWINSATDCVEELVSDRYNRNCSLLAKLREDANSERLLEACMEDFSMGRMTKPKPLEMADLTSSNLSPRFGVEQGGKVDLHLHRLLHCCALLLILGIKADGSKKIRPIDDMSASGKL